MIRKSRSSLAHAIFIGHYLHKQTHWEMRRPLTTSLELEGATVLHLADPTFWGMVIILCIIWRRKKSSHPTHYHRVKLHNQTSTSKNLKPYIARHKVLMFRKLSENIISMSGHIFKAECINGYRQVNISWLHLLLSGDVELNPGPYTGEDADVKEKLLTICDKLLTMEDWYAVVSAVGPLTTRWDDLGHKLGMHRDTLDFIARDKDTPGLCLNETIAQWLQLNYITDKYSRPSWRSLAEAVVDLNKSLFLKIASDHKVKDEESITIEKEQPNLSDQAMTSAETVKPKPLLHENTDDKSAKFRWEFIPSLTYPVLQLKDNFSKEQREKFEVKLKQDSLEMITTFNNLKYDFYNYMISKKVPVTKLVIFLGRLYQLSTIRVKRDQPTIRKDLMKAQTIDDIMFIIQSYCSFFNFSLIETMVDKFEELHGFKSRLEEYKEAFFKYAESRLVYCPSKIGLNTETGLGTKATEIVFILDDVYKDCRLNHLETLRKDLCDIFRIPIEILFLDSVGEYSYDIREKQPYADNLNCLDAYHKILAAGDSLEMLFVKIIFIGPPRLGKTTARRRLLGEIADINSAAEPEQPSTGAVETGGNVVVRNISNTTALMTPSEWSVMKDLTEEAYILLQFIYNRNMELNQSHVPSSEGSSKEIHTADKDEKFYSSGEKEKVHSDKIIEEVSNAQISSNENSISSSLKEQKGSDKPHGFTEIPKLFRNAMNPKLWKEDIKLLFRDSALIKIEDTGGQPEFMDMLPALTIGPALYLLFCKLIDDLLSRYTVSYHSPLSRESTIPVESSYTVEEVLLTALASVSCFSSYSAISEVNIEEAHSSEVKEILTSSFKSVAYIVGTHRDLVSEEQIKEFDQQLQHSIRSTDFFREDLVQFFSEERMILTIDNMNGGVKEIKKVRKFLERGIHQHFKKLRIPASWFVFSLCLRARTKRIASLNDCYQLAQQLNVPSKETKIALWFLHHYAGVLMYFPDLPELKDTIICDTQIIYDSVTNLIINTFKFGSVSKWASERFRETGQFSLKDIRGATSNVSGDYIPLNQLLKLLEHLNIIAPIVQDDSHPSQTKPIQSSKAIYFMPCVLQNATSEELDKYSSCNFPASLMIRYKCGFVPLGIFPAVIAHLVGHSPLDLIKQDIKKNCVQFRYGTDYDKVTLIYRTKYCEIHIERERNVVTPPHKVCHAVRKIIESTLKAVSSCMNYAFSLCYQLSFECPFHPGEDHLCVVDSKESIPHKMKCLKNGKNPQPVVMQSQHLVWFGKALTFSDGCTSASNLQPKGDSNLTTLNIKTILMDEDFPADRAEELGIFLGLKKGRISTLRTNNNGNADKLLTTIIEEWLQNDKKKSWDRLANAVKRCGYSLLANKILKQYCGVKRKVFQKLQQQQSSILMTPVEKMGLTGGLNIIYKRTNGSDKEEVLLGKDFTAEKNKEKEEKSCQLLPSLCVLILILGVIGISILWTFL